MSTSTDAAPDHSTDPSTELSPHALRSLLGTFLTGVTVVTCRRGGTVHGATVNAFTSVSLRPPLVLVALDRRSRLAGLIADGPFVVNILAADQRDVALHFAGTPGAAPLAWRDEDTDAPRLDGTVGHLRCRPWDDHDGGDHVLQIAEVTAFAARGGSPLLFYRGGFPRLVDGEGDPTWAGSLDGHDAARLVPPDIAHTAAAGRGTTPEGAR